MREKSAFMTAVFSALGAGDGRWVGWVRATYVGPPINRATVDLIRQQTTKAVHIGVSKVIVTAESAARTPTPASK